MFGVNVDPVLLWWGMQDTNEFRLTRKQFADTQGISVDLLKKRQKKGMYENVYIVKDGKYFFKPCKTDRPIAVGSPGKNSPRKRNRGNHFNSKNPRYTNQLKQHNELKMLAKLKHSVDNEVQNLLPEAVELAKQKKRERLQQSLDTPIKKPYTNGIVKVSPSNPYPFSLNPYSHRLYPENFKATNRGKAKKTIKYYW